MKDLVLTIESCRQVTESVCEMTLSGQIPPFKAGQFLHLAVPGCTLRRPFCITSGDDRHVTVLFAIVGGGTKILSEMPIGTKLDCILPIGNGFPVAKDVKKAMIIGGGLGVAPLLPILAQNPEITFCVLLGFGSKAQVVEYDAFCALSQDVRVATDDGSFGFKGRVTDLAAQLLDQIKPDAVYVCGPSLMIKAAQKIAFDCPAYVSMEARMGCGVGACLVCTCPVVKSEVVRNLRVCVDGPVFPLKDVVL